MVIMFEDAYKQQPNNEELGAETFFANVRATNWKAAQQVNFNPTSWVQIVLCYK
jgi:N-terminal acetyltransferase B complex non-catalytic subunit